MPWRKVSLMDQREEFVRLFQRPDVNRRELCRRFGISPKVGYKWLARATAEEKDWAQDRSRRPHVSPTRSPTEIETAVLEIRDAHPAWGARKIRRRLEDQHKSVPVASTVHAILARHDRIPPPTQPPQYIRFEHPAPNDVWQMDFKGRFALGDRQMCHPLTMVDDHSRYAVCLQACTIEQSETVQQHLERTFRRYGLPNAFLVDNGVPWGTCSEVRWTRLRVWLLKLGVRFGKQRWHAPEAFRGELLAIRRLASDGRFGVFFGAHQIACIDLRNDFNEPVTHVSEHPLPISPGRTP